MLDPEGAGDEAPQKKKGGEGENRWPRLETLKPRRLTAWGGTHGSHAHAGEGWAEGRGRRR